MPATTLDVIHALLDMVVSYDDEATEEENHTAVRTAFARLNEIEALTATMNDETGVLHLDATPLLTGIGVTIDTLIRQIAHEHSQDRATIIGTVRQHLDNTFSN